MLSHIAVIAVALVASITANNVVPADLVTLKASNSTSVQNQAGRPLVLTSTGFRIPGVWPYRPVSSTMVNRPVSPAIGVRPVVANPLAAEWNDNKYKMERETIAAIEKLRKEQWEFQDSVEKERQVLEDRRRRERWEREEMVQKEIREREERIRMEAEEYRKMRNERELKKIQEDAERERKHKEEVEKRRRAVEIEKEEYEMKWRRERLQWEEEQRKRREQAEKERIEWEEESQQETVKTTVRTSGKGKETVRTTVTGEEKSGKRKSA